MHVELLEVDLGLLLRFILTLVVTVIGLLYVVKNFAFKYFEVDANFDSAPQRIPQAMQSAFAGSEPLCANCGGLGKNQCSRCKSVRYCSIKCQEIHWKSEHRLKCKHSSKVSFISKSESKKSNLNSRVTLAPARGTCLTIKELRDELFPYDEFVNFFNWKEGAFPPCGLLNCGNSCFANVVLQCLTFTKPLAAYLLVKGHRYECKRNDWCFLCILQQHVERASQSSQPFTPFNILSRLTSLGGDIGFGKQEDAHEFMRIVIDTMQSLCLDEYGGEKSVPSPAQETTLINHIFGGILESQVTCTECDRVSNQMENIMDLTVEIQGEAESLEGCLDQFTAKEWLYGDNMYKCEGCKEYVKASKRLTIKKAPNVLTIALKRFQSGRFGKINKRVAFPELLDLNPYMSQNGDGSDTYRLYGVVVHVDMLNASFFGHYICYMKDFNGNWYRVDDCKVERVEIEEVLCERAYMLLYNRVSVRQKFHSTKSETSAKIMNGDSFGSYSCHDDASTDVVKMDVSDCEDDQSPEIKS